MRILKEKVDSIVLSAGSETMIYRKLQVLTCTDLTRLQRLALIQHPNIATLYSIEINK